MCGIAGLISDEKDIHKKLLVGHRMQPHRGPDARGLLEQRVGKWEIGFAFQRLSILDLSEAGNQPMASADKKSWLIYNGEVYNYKEIRVDLEKLGLTFNGGSDTEVVLAALKQWGPDEALSRFNGMWAFAWLDGENRRLILSRDRVGIKPLYFFLSENQLCFASEIKTILEMASAKFKINCQVAGEYLLQSLLDTSNETFFKGISKLPAAHYGVIDLSKETLRVETKPYWRFPLEEEVALTEDQIIERVREIFFDAVKIRLRSDVPVGVLLSGGVDSSSIATAMRKTLGKERALNVLSAVSNDSSYDESPFIDLMAKHLDSPVHKIVLDFPAEQAFDYLSQISWFNDEPVGSFSNVAHFLLMQQAKALGVTVVLSGQGGDELLCGYKKYLGFYIQFFLRRTMYLQAAKVLWSFYKQGTVVNQFTIGEAKRYLPHFLKPKELDIRGEGLNGFAPPFVGLSSNTTVDERQKLDILRFSVPALVHYEDRMSMAWSREVRLPFLDYRMIETLVPAPIDMKLRNGWTKYIFRKAMEPYLPKEICWRKDKQGFVNPQSEWLKNELRQGVLEYFGEDALLFKYHLVNRKNIVSKYETYCRQKKSEGNIWFKDIFNPLAMEIWLRRFETYLA